MRIADVARRRDDIAAPAAKVYMWRSHKERGQKNDPDNHRPRGAERPS
jgi:hypothetical protein